MQLSLFRVGNNLADPTDEPWEDEFEIKLAPSHPVLELDLTDLLERRSTEVLHVKVTRAGIKQVAHFHLSLSVTANDRVKAEVTAMTGPNASVSKSVVAKWREPVNPTPPKPAFPFFGSPGIGKTSRTD